MWRKSVAIRLSSVVLDGRDQPDFEKLKARGWVNPLGIRDEPLEHSLSKTFRGLVVHLHQHNFGGHQPTRYPTYTEIGVYSEHDDMFHKPTLKGEGSPFSFYDLLGLVSWLEEELEEARTDIPISPYKPTLGEEPF
jgi:hypothetical protein